MGWLMLDSTPWANRPQVGRPTGQRTDAQGKPLASALSAVGSGFTGHEHDDDLGLINMRGRVFDPVIEPCSDGIGTSAVRIGPREEGGHGHGHGHGSDLL